MTERRIHLIAPAAPCRPFLQALKLDSARSFIGYVQSIVGSAYRLTGNPELLDAEEDDRTGGRNDDLARARDVEQALGDSTVAAVIALRGGAWFTRILPHIDFGVLDRRATRVAVFGFSEITPLINITGAHRSGLGVYYMGPSFLTYGLRRYAATKLGKIELTAANDWMHSRLHEEVRKYFGQVIGLIEGREEDIRLTARLVAGDPPRQGTASFMGGNLTVLSTMIGSRFTSAVEPRGRWLLLEDFNDKPERFDRFLSHLTLAGFWEHCDGVLLGDFHNSDGDLLEAVVALLAHHLPERRVIAVLATHQVGHVWPMTPLPLNLPGTIEPNERGSYSICWATSSLAVRQARLDPSARA